MSETLLHMCSAVSIQLYQYKIRSSPLSRWTLAATAPSPQLGLSVVKTTLLKWKVSRCPVSLRYGTNTQRRLPSLKVLAYQLEQFCQCQWLNISSMLILSQGLEASVDLVGIPYICDYTAVQGSKSINCGQLAPSNLLNTGQQDWPLLALAHIGSLQPQQGPRLLLR